jgi:hypothetical protein
VWGDVTPGTNILGPGGSRYVVEPHNAQGFIAQRNESGGKNEIFEALDPIDQAKFCAAP